jgi:hypothetical protein
MWRKADVAARDALGRLPLGQRPALELAQGGAAG